MSHGRNDSLDYANVEFGAVEDALDDAKYSIRTALQRRIEQAADLEAQNKELKAELERIKLCVTKELEGARVWGGMGWTPLHLPQFRVARLMRLFNMTVQETRVK